MSEKPGAFGFEKPIAEKLKVMAGGSLSFKQGPFSVPGNSAGVWLMEALEVITAAVDSTTAGEGLAAIAKRDKNGATGAELVSHAGQAMSHQVYNMGGEIAEGDFFIGVRALSGSIFAVSSLPTNPTHAKTSGTVTARSGTTLGTGSVDLLEDDLTTTGVTITAKNTFSQSIASGTYCIVLLLASGDYTIISADCP